MAQKGTVTSFDCEKIHLSENKKYSNHTDKLQIIVVLSGKIDFSYLKEKHFLVDGDLILLYPNYEGELTATEDTQALRVAFLPQNVLYLEQTAFDVKYFASFLINGTAPQIIKNNEKAKEVLDKIFNEYSAKGLGYSTLIKAHIVNLLVLILRQLKECGKLPQRENKSEEISHIMQKAMAFTCEHFKTVTEKQAADHCNLSYSYFSRSFKKAAGIGFSDYLNNLKINEAQRLLLFTNKTVTDIAMELGYSTASHFISQFKKRNGVSPKQYTTNLKGENYEF